jgi:hypothetical protein
MLGYLLWLLVGVAIGVYTAPTISEAKARLLRRLRAPPARPACGCRPSYAPVIPPRRSWLRPAATRPT